MFLSLFAWSLLTAPVFITAGAYIGFENQKFMALLQNKPPPGISPEGKPLVVETAQYCQKTFGYVPYPYRYIYNPNQWGDPNDTGDLCITVTSNNSVPMDFLDSFNWTVTWDYPQGDVDHPVHAFPNALLRDEAMPMQISNITDLTVDLAWHYAVGNNDSTITDEASLVAANLNANVAIDMFLSDDKEKSSNATGASHEVMIWLGRYGAATQPLGNQLGIKKSITVANTRFDLYGDKNGVGQTVFTWMAETNVTDFKGNIIDLLTTGLADQLNAPTGDTYLGYISFGTEAFYATAGNMTFFNPTLTISVNGE